MATFHFDLVSPEKLVFSGDVQQVDVPGSEGDFGVLAEHAPLIAMLRPGIVTIYGDSGPTRVVVSGGFAEVNPESLTILADSAVPLDQFERATLTAMIDEAQAALAAATDDRTRDRLADRLDQLKALDASIAGGTAAAH